MRSKYGNRKTGGYDSKKEARRAAELQLLERSGVISELKFQPQFLLLPSQKDEHGRVIERPVSYFGDFSYQENGVLIVEDIKSEITRRDKAYVLKRKMLLFFHHIQLRET